jgi:hypothetical protein
MAQPATGGSSVNRDLGFKADALPTIVPIVGNDTTEGTGVKVDLKGYEGAMVLLHVGVSGDAASLSGSVKMLASVQDSDAGSTGWADIASTKMRIDTVLNATGGSPTIARDQAFADIDTSTKDDMLYKVTLLPGAGVKRYVRAKVTFTGTHTSGTPISALVVKGFPRVAPAV